MITLGEYHTIHQPFRVFTLKGHDVHFECGTYQGVLCGIMSVPQNIFMDPNNVYVVKLASNAIHAGWKQHWSYLLYCLMSFVVMHHLVEPWLLLQNWYAKCHNVLTLCFMAFRGPSSFNTLLHKTHSPKLQSDITLPIIFFWHVYSNGEFTFVE